MNKPIRSVLFVFAVFTALTFYGQTPVKITVFADSAKQKISPYIYGKNNSFSDNPANPLTDYQWQRLIDAGITMFRENGGNNATKYNWRKKLSSHPDWYNNVYSHDWDYATLRHEQHIPGTQIMWAFQLIGKVAKTGAYNFNDWNFNQSQGWSGTGQNLAGGGQVNKSGGSKALVEGNPNLYLENWPADSTVGILDHWFGIGGLGLDSNLVRYWDMDNEPEIWNGTHDDVMPAQPGAEAFMQLYFDVAKKARSKFPGIKLLGPVTANEWQWYSYNGGKVSYNSKDYTWLEYFILRVAEEQKRTGIRLLDVLDIHFYPGETNASDILQLHRVFFDKTYNYPGANGVKRSGPGGWDDSITKEYIFARCSEWLEKYMGPNHGVKLGISEMGIKGENPNVTALWYASTIGEFAKQGVEIFTPWDWKTGMYEVVHLFSRFGQKNFVKATSSDEEFVSVYPMADNDSDSMTVFVVNRSTNQSKTLDLAINGFHVKNGRYKSNLISQLPQGETFVSHTQNALKESETEVAFDKMNFTLAPLSIMAVQLVKSIEETKKVTFNVNGNIGGNVVALSGVGVNIDGYFAYTGQDGSVTINVPTGLHDITLTKNGFMPKGFKMNILTDNVFTYTLQVQTFNILFKVKDKETGLLLDNCKITANSVAKTTDINGQASFTGVPSFFNVELSRNFYRDTIYTNIGISSDTSIVLFIESLKYKVTFRILDIYTSRGIWEASTTVGTNIQVSDYSGDTFFELPSGINSFKIENPAYKTATGTVNIKSDTSFVYYLTPTLGDVKFRLKTGTAPVDGAEIKIGTITQTTNLLGIVNYYDLLADSTYNFSITKPGYQSILGSFYLRRDTTIDLNMLETASPIIKNIDSGQFSVWPNPASNLLYLKTSQVELNSVAVINDIAGKIVKVIPVNSETIKIEINDFSDGIYILQVHSKNSRFSTYFIKRHF